MSAVLRDGFARAVPDMEAQAIKDRAEFQRGYEAGMSDMSGMIDDELAFVERENRSRLTVIAVNAFAAGAALAGLLVYLLGNGCAV